MGKERLLPTGKQLFVCDNIFQGEIAGGGEFSWMRQKYKKKKEKEKEKTNKQTLNFHDSSWGKMSGMEGERQSE